MRSSKAALTSARVHIILECHELQVRPSTYSRCSGKCAAETHLTHLQAVFLMDMGCLIDKSAMEMSGRCP